MLLVLLVFLGLAGPLEDGQAALDRGDPARAMVVWSEALVAARAAGDTRAEVDTLLRLAGVHREVGSTRAARSALDQAATGADVLKDGSLRAQVEVSRALLDWSVGDDAAATARLEDAFRAFRDLEDPVGAATAALNLGALQLELGRLDAAATALDVAEALAVQLHDDALTVDLTIDRALLLRRRGRLGEALERLEAALQISRTIGDVRREGDVLLDLGLVLEDLGRNDEARRRYDAALALARSRRDVRRQARVLLALASLARGTPAAVAHLTAARDAYRELGDASGAASAALGLALERGTGLEAVLAEAKAAGDRRLEAIVSLDLAATAREPRQRARHLARARALASATGSTAVAWRVDHLDGLAKLAAGRRDEGVALLRSAVDTLELARAGLRRDDQAQFVQRHDAVYRALIDALLDAGDPTTAALYAERQQLVDLPRPSASEVPALAEMEQIARARDHVEATLASAGDTEQAAALRARLGALRVAFAGAVDHLRATEPAFAARVRVAPEDLEAVVDELEPGVAVLQPIVLDDRIALLVFRHDGLKAVTVDVPRDEVLRAVRRLSTTLQAGMTDDPAFTDALLDKLGGWLVEPVKAELAGSTVLVVSVTGALRQVPFAILRVDGRYVVEDRAVVAVTHVGSLRAQGTEPRFHLEASAALLVGNPDGTLPGAEAEVAALARELPGATTLVGAAGTRAALTAAAAGKTTLHLATHGRIDADAPERSYLVLAGDRLAYAEIPGIRPWMPQMRMVVLSACESALPVDARSEGGVSIAGLAAQFRRAGVETLVASLWKVDDEATRPLMEAFYGELGRGTDIARSLQAAQRALLRDPKTAHPWYWGAFVVVGDWR